MKQITVRMPYELYSEIDKLAKESDRPINYTICLLLQLGAKEKTRKRKGASKDDHKV
jgi:hypothetical protein